MYQILLNGMEDIYHFNLYLMPVPFCLQNMKTTKWIYYEQKDWGYYVTNKHRLDIITRFFLHNDNGN